MCRADFVRLKLIATVFLLALSLSAQSDRGTITGTVTDPANAAIPNATLTLRNNATGAVYESITTGSG